MNESEPGHVTDPREMAAKLRAAALATTAEEVGDEGATVFGALMEIGMLGGALTLAAFSSGDASLYFSQGGGMIGGIGHKEIREAALRMISVARGLVDEFAPAADPGLPDEGDTQFIVLTTDGPLAVTLPTDLAASGDSLLTPLFAAGQDVLTQMRLLQASGTPEG